ncbi:MAG: group II intron reverse transcriptase domain-containing protein [Lachnospiraceae bacterium]|nr:group II intron reverse transcriptase domain-containing protein [Lachnospiraceae bacterium]
MSILNELYNKNLWNDFLQYKLLHHNLSKSEADDIAEYINSERYLSVLDPISNNSFVPPLPYKKEINKDGTSKKRIVYSYPQDFNIFLKIIAYMLYKYDYHFCENCYAFRKNYGVKDAVSRIKSIDRLSEKYCLKVDIHNYFNSIDTELLLKKLEFMQTDDEPLYHFLKTLLTEDKAITGKLNDRNTLAATAGKNKDISVITEKRGAMAGTPISPFLANIYMSDVDKYFYDRGIIYFRYSDDILIMTDSMNELNAYKDILYNEVEEHKLSLNPAKVHIYMPGETCDFLGFSYNGNGIIDIAEHTKKKIKDKIRRKAHALRRWSEQKELSYDKAAKGFINAMNHKFFDNGGSNDFSWCRFYCPILTTDAGLKEIDQYMQQYIRYCVTGRHYKGNYKISYAQMKEWGYRSLVNEYYKGKQK